MVSSRLHSGSPLTESTMEGYDADVGVVNGSPYNIHDCDRRVPVATVADPRMYSQTTQISTSILNGPPVPSGHERNDVWVGQVSKHPEFLSPLGNIPVSEEDLIHEDFMELLGSDNPPTTDVPSISKGSVCTNIVELM